MKPHYHTVHRLQDDYEKFWTCHPKRYCFGLLTILRRKRLKNSIYRKAFAELPLSAYRQLFQKKIVINSLPRGLITREGTRSDNQTNFVTKYHLSHLFFLWPIQLLINHYSILKCLHPSSLHCLLRQYISSQISPFSGGIHFCFPVIFLCTY